MSTEKPKTADGYNKEQTLACERVLVTLLSAFGTLKDTVRLIGGLVPRYLTPEIPPNIPAHAGTTDVDIVLNLVVVAEGEGYASLKDQLKQRGFNRYTKPDTKVSSSWQWELKLSSNESVIVEFLCDAVDRDKAGKVASIGGEKISAIGILYAGITHDWYGEKEVTAELFDNGGISTEVVRYADLTSFIVLKSIAFEQRGENKDAGDLIHVMQYAGEPEEIGDEIISRYNSGQHTQAINEALQVLRVRFCDDDRVKGYMRNGSVAAAKFRLGIDIDEDDFEREKRYVSGLVTQIVSYVQEHINANVE